MTDVVMPQMGESIVEGTLTKWLKKPGDKVERDEPLFEISTDKVDTEIPSPAAGVLAEVLVQEGQTVQVNAVVARIDADGGAAAAAPAPPSRRPLRHPPPAPPTPPAAAPAPPPAPPPGAEALKPAPAGAGPYPFSPGPRPAKATPAEASAKEDPAGPLSPLVRKMARENNIDLSKVTGTGAGGRITKEDVEARLSRAAGPRPPAHSARPRLNQRPPAPVAPIAQPGPTAKTRIEAMSNMRIKIAEHMVMSKRVSAHVTTVHRVDMTKVAKMRAKHKEDFAARYGMSLTFLPFVARAAVEALRTFPIVNAPSTGPTSSTTTKSTWASR